MVNARRTQTLCPIISCFQPRGAEPRHRLVRSCEMIDPQDRYSPWGWREKHGVLSELERCFVEPPFSARAGSPSVSFCNAPIHTTTTHCTVPSPPKRPATNRAELMTARPPRWRTVRCALTTPVLLRDRRLLPATITSGVVGTIDKYTLTCILIVCRFRHTRCDVQTHRVLAPRRRTDGASENHA